MLPNLGHEVALEALPLGLGCSGRLSLLMHLVLVLLLQQGLGLRELEQDVRGFLDLAEHAQPRLHDRCGIRIVEVQQLRTITQSECRNTEKEEHGTRTSAGNTEHEIGMSNTENRTRNNFGKHGTRNMDIQSTNTPNTECIVCATKL